MNQRFDAFSCDAVTVARSLIGQRLVRKINGRRMAGRIVEVEAYLGLEDAAAHTFNGRRTARNESMYLPGGHAYVYMIYGIHHCLNIVCGGVDEGTAVLIRAVEPTEGIDSMFANRQVTRRRKRPLRERDLCSGPGKLAQALDITRELDGEPLLVSDRLWIEAGEDAYSARSTVVAGPRIGVEYAGEWAQKPLRFFVAGNPHVSIDTR